VKKLSQQEAAVTELQQGQAAIETAADLAHKGKVYCICYLLHTYDFLHSPANGVQFD